MTLCYLDLLLYNKMEDLIYTFFFILKNVYLMQKLSTFIEKIYYIFGDIICFVEYN